MLLLACVTLTLGLALAADDSTAQTMTMCCIPPKWQGNLIDLKAKDMTVLVFAYDEVNQLEGYYVVPVGGQTPVYQGFTDYKNMMTYSVKMTGATPYKCTQSKTTRQFVGGCSSNVTSSVSNMMHRGNSSVGPPSNQVAFDSWSYSFGGMDITIALSRNGCIPLLENVKSNMDYVGPAFETLFMFDEVSTTISSPELLTIPTACLGSSVIG